MTEAQLSISIETHQLSRRGVRRVRAWFVRVCWQAGGVRVFGTTLLITGKEELLASRVVEERQKAALVEQPGADVNRIHASELAEVMLSEVVGGSLFSSHIVAIIDDVGSVPSDQVEQFIALAKEPGPDLCLILHHEGGVKGRKLLDGLKKAKVETVAVAAPKAHELPGFCVAEAKRHRIRMTGEAGGALVESIGHDLRALSAAVSQLAADADGDEIDASLIRRYFAGRAEVTAFKVADLALAGHRRAAIEHLRWALHTGAAPVLVTSAMANGFRGMGKYLAEERSRMSDADLGRKIGVPYWKIRDYRNWSRAWSHQGIGDSIRLIAAADADVKGAAVDADYALERMLLSVLSCRRS